MPEKDPASFSLLTYLWVILISSWGGIVSFHRKIRAGHARPFNVMELLGEIATSAFVGVVTFWLCEAAGINSLVAAALIAISGHMGSRAIWQLEKWAEGKLLVGNGFEINGKADKP